MIKKVLLPVLVLGFVGCGPSAKKEEAKTVEANALFRIADKPIDFAAMKPKDVTDAAAYAVIAAENHLGELIGSKDHVSYDNTVLKYDLALNDINKVYYPMELLYETHPDEAVRKAAVEADSTLRAFIYDLDYRNDIYLTLKAYTKTQEAKELSPQRDAYLKALMLKYKQGGIELSKEKQKQVVSCKASIDRLGIKFRGNIAANQGIVEITPADTAGIDADFLEARKNEKGNYYLDMTYPTRGGIMGYATSEKVRKKYTLAFKNRGMPENITVLDSVLYFRNQLANTLGYNTYAQYKLATRMAKTNTAVWEFEDKVKADIQKKADYDYAKLLAVKSKMTGKKETTIDEWELSLLTTKIKKDEYSIDERELSKYFELNSVLDGLFELTQKLFGLKYEKIENPNTWHEDVTMYNCYDASTNKLLGRFYLDLFPRENKYSHAACFPIRSGYEDLVAEAALVCNFPKPAGGKPSLMKHGNVETFFHEFGHLIHSLVARSEVPSLSGINEVKLDFVEAPSQIYENWAYQKEILNLFAKHYETGEPLPEDLLDKKLAAKNLNSGLNALRQVFYGSFDMHLHDRYKPYDGSGLSDVVNELYPITMFEPLGGTNFHASFGHLIGYGAGYYGYLWSKVYAQDMWSRFEEEGILNQELGLEYREKILNPGGSKDAYEMVKDFLGRDPNNEALLKELGADAIE